MPETMAMRSGVRSRPAGRSARLGVGRCGPGAGVDPGGEPVGGRRDNIHTLNSLTKFYAIPGLRLGFGVFPAAVARLMREHLPPWTVNHLAQVVGVRVLVEIPELGGRGLLPGRDVGAVLRT